MPAIYYPSKGFYRISRAIATNLLAIFAPRWYIQMTGETGRGSDPETSADIAEYFWRCFHEYFQILGIADSSIQTFLTGKRVLEYGPGDLPVVSWLMVAYGAERAICIDRFPLLSMTEKNSKVLGILLDRLAEPQRNRAIACLQKTSPTGFNPSLLDYRICPDGLSALKGTVDLIISRAVLEHVNNLEASFIDMRAALRANGVMIHQVDLKSHGLHQNNTLDFLTWPV